MRFISPLTSMMSRSSGDSHELFFSSWPNDSSCLSLMSSLLSYSSLIGFRDDFRAKITPEDRALSRRSKSCSSVSLRSTFGLCESRSRIVRQPTARRSRQGHAMCRMSSRRHTEPHWLMLTQDLSWVAQSVAVTARVIN